MIELLQFQQEASTQIADRFFEYYADPEVVGSKKRQRSVPFFQALGALTGSGKTIILADTVRQMAAALPSAPVILWISKAKVVVGQSYVNLAPGGKYNHLLQNADVRQLAEYKPDDVREMTSPMVLFATVGTFNQKDMAEGKLTIYRSDIDATEQSVWDALYDRQDGNGTRRPLFVVYDEAQNLSDQQTELLLRQEPDAFLVASATMTLPAQLAEDVKRLKDSGRSDEWLATTVRSSAVVASGLVKSTLSLGGYRSPMEETISSMLADMRSAEQDAREHNLDISPKAIYVCKTNILADDAFRRDDPRQPFSRRQAPPILIWRYLTEHCNVQPQDIAVYANLDTHKDYPLPGEFILFGRGENDYQEFSEGRFRHIIFNLTLQEGWDDPETYFAYVDKSMESTVQITQIIGRVLRQPGATRYSPERLNTAHFYVRVDKNETFNEVLSEVAKQLGSDAPEIKIVATRPGRPKPQEFAAKDQRKVPRTGLDGQAAMKPIEDLLAGMIDFSGSSRNTAGIGGRLVVQQKVGESNSEAGDWQDFQQANKVSARWVFHREVKRLYAQALNVVSTADSRFDVRVGIGSPAYKQIVDLAEKVVRAYVDNVTLVQRKPNPYVVGSIMAREAELYRFANALHVGYDNLNPTLELPFAQALDAANVPWVRNTPKSGYGIPLVSIGDTQNFYPDFILWAGNSVICVDTKGSHLLPLETDRKLLSVRPRSDGSPKLLIRFVSDGKHTSDREKVSQDGFTVWGLKSNGTRRPQHFGSLQATVEHLVGLGIEDVE
ncbi:DEAD/DEAH box helicase [Streptomyces flaveolus]|uniref:hypothetical protein n=1 Tax=Streptomyces flaveolus TaxID=67297 RepID=UPI0037FDF9D4